jgi:hypothetical protein
MTTVENKIDTLITSLTAPLSAQESADGWTPESKSAMADFFQDLRDKLRTGGALPPVLHVTRAMDHWGVNSGPLLDLAAQISNELRATGRA